VNRNSLLPETLTALAGVAFALLLLFALASVDPLVEATDQELIDWWTDTGNQRATAISTYFFIGAAGCFLVFLAGLRARLAVAEGGAAALTGLAFAAGVCFTAVILVGDIGRGAIAHSVRFGDEPLPGPDTLRALTTFSQLMFGLVAMPLSAVIIAAASVVILRTRTMGAWLGWAGLATATVIAVFVVLLIGPWASPFLQLWTVAASFELWRTRHRVAGGLTEGAAPLPQSNPA
jgi:hypothetical protein